MLDNSVPVRRDYDMERYHRHHVRHADGFKRLQKRLQKRLSRRCARTIIVKELQPHNELEFYGHFWGGAFIKDGSWELWVGRAFNIVY